MTANADLADQAAALAERHEPRTSGRRAAAALALLAELEQEAVPR